MSIRSSINPAGSNIDSRLSDVRYRRGLSETLSKDDRLARAKLAGRIAVVSAGALAASFLASSEGDDGQSEIESVPTSQVVAEQGDSAWTIANKAIDLSGIDRDDVAIEPVVRDIESRNGDIHPGETVTFDAIPGAVTESVAPVAPVAPIGG